MTDKQEILRKVTKDIESLNDMHWLISQLQRIYTTQLVRDQIIHFFNNVPYMKKPAEDKEQKIRDLMK